MGSFAIQSCPPQFGFKVFMPFRGGIIQDASPYTSVLINEDIHANFPGPMALSDSFTLHLSIGQMKTASLTSQCTGLFENGYSK